MNRTTDQERQTLMHYTRQQMLAALGHLVLAEGDGSADTGGSVAHGDQAGTDGQDGAQQAAQQAQDGKGGDDSGPGDWQMEQLPAGAQDYIRSLRQEAKKDRVAQQESAADKARREITDAIAQALGLGDTEPDKVTDQLATITQERDQALAAVKAYETQQTIRAAADIVAVDADKALDLKALDKALEGIDLTDTKAVQDALLKVAEQHPHIKTASTVERTGGNHHSGEGNRPKPRDLTAAIAAAYQ